MSYRSVKRMLGETSLERKCRFLFGSGLLLLITGSFYFYARLTTRLVDDQNLTTARLLLAPVILERHWKWSESSAGGNEVKESANAPSDSRSQRITGLRIPGLVERMAGELKPNELRDYNWALFKTNNFDDPTTRPLDIEGYQASLEIRGGKKEVTRFVREKNRQEFTYYGGIYASESCVACHRQHNNDPGLEEGDLLGMMKISIPLKKTQEALALNNAILLATAIITAFLAMLAAYSIVRYVIVKPVLHLKEVSDAISRGNLETRADIRTGDEFEELSHAFNRMLRHLVTVQDELRHLNGDLDGKVDELAQVNLRLYDLNNIKNEFLATMSHELRTPLNSILGFSDVLLGSQNLTDKQRRYVANIQTSGKALMNLINDVLDLAKIESGKMELHLAEFSMADLVERMAGSLAPLAEKKNIQLTTEIDPRLPVMWQDSGKLQQILNNLLSNAIKFTPDGGRVKVAVEYRHDRDLALVVEDTGIGIPLEEQERIFEKFRQGKSVPGQRDTLTREYEGTGLGLSIIKELSKLLGGEVFLQSEFGKGSTFTVLVPARLEPLERATDAPTR